MIMYGAGMSDSNAHDPKNLPIVLLGGGCGQLKGGRHLRYPKDTPVANLHVTLLDKLGVQIDNIGDSYGEVDGFVRIIRGHNEQLRCLPHWKACLAGWS